MRSKKVTVKSSSKPNTQKVLVNKKNRIIQARHSYDEIIYARNPMDIHKVYHKFLAYFLDGEGHWKFTGYDLMTRVEQYVKRNKQDGIIINSIDDDMHCSSFLVIIPHKSDNEYWGTTIIVIPQTDKPCTFFLYPGETTSLVSSLNIIVDKIVHMNGQF